MNKIKEVKKMAIKAGNENILIQVDGGIGKDNVKDVIEVNQETQKQTVIFEKPRN